MPFNGNFHERCFEKFYFIFGHQNLTGGYTIMHLFQVKDFENSKNINHPVEYSK